MALPLIEDSGLSANHITLYLEDFFGEVSEDINR